MAILVSTMNMMLAITGLKSSTKRISDWKVEGKYYAALLQYLFIKFNVSPRHNDTLKINIQKTWD